MSEPKKAADQDERDQRLIARPSGSLQDQIDLADLEARREYAAKYGPAEDSITVVAPPPAPVAVKGAVGFGMEREHRRLESPGKSGKVDDAYDSDDRPLVDVHPSKEAEKAQKEHEKALQEAADENEKNARDAADKAEHARKAAVKAAEPHKAAEHPHKAAETHKK